MSDLKQFETWFITGSQHLYGPKTLEKVAEHSKQMVGIELLVIDEHTQIPDFKNELNWNDMYFLFFRNR